MDGREDARHAIEVSRARLATIAEELARRTSMDWVKDRAKSRALARTKAIARPALPWALGAVAVAIGAFAFVRWGGTRGEKVGAALKRAGRLANKSARVAASSASAAVRGAKLASAGTREVAKAYGAVDDARHSPSRQDKWLAIAGVVFTALAGGLGAVRAFRQQRGA